jgi:hypothetical protein
MTQTSRPGGRSDDLIEKGADQFKKVADRVEGLATGAAGQMREVSDRTGEVAGNFKGALDKSVKDQPSSSIKVDEERTPPASVDSASASIGAEL